MGTDRQHRSKQRQASVLLRLSNEEREELRRRAADQGLTLQVYMQSVLFNCEPATLPGGRPKGRPSARSQVMHQGELQLQTTDQEAELSMTG